jgi:hypothetical protein
MLNLPQAYQLFGSFRSLNLVSLIHNLEADRAVRGDWRRDGALCPLAHGLASARDIERVQLCPLGEVRLGVSSALLDDFLDGWDSGELPATRLIGLLRHIWSERLADAEVVQALLGAEEHRGAAFCGEEVCAC